MKLPGLLFFYSSSFTLHFFYRLYLSLSFAQYYISHLFLLPSIPLSLPPFLLHVYIYSGDSYNPFVTPKLPLHDGSKLFKKLMEIADVYKPGLSHFLFLFNCCFLFIFKNKYIYLRRCNK